MRNTTKWSGVLVAGLLVATGALVAPAHAEDARSDIYGYVMTDIGYNSIGIDPDWFDVQRPTKLPLLEDGFGEDGSVFFSVRQTRFGMKSWIPTEMGELRTTFEWEMFGVGDDAGQTTIRLRHAYGELGRWGAGQYWSPFMDIDVFPNTIEYWGPNGMAFYRNVQVRFMPIQGETRMTIALERPGASADQGSAAGHVDFGGVTPRFPLPDLSAEYRRAIKRGYIEASGIVRKIEWQDNTPTPTDVSGDVMGWGLHLSSNIKAGESNVIRLSALYGEGVENYMNDAPVDVATEPTGDPASPVDGVALPVTGFVAFLDHTWNSKFSSSVGFSMVDIDNSEGQGDGAFKTGQYALANLLYTPVQNVMMGGEVGWIHRENKANVADAIEDVDNLHIQFSFRYNFNVHLGGGQ